LIYLPLLVLVLVLVVLFNLFDFLFIVRAGMSLMVWEALIMLLFVVLDGSLGVQLEIGAWH
jgi:hypothetical protein